MLFSRYFTHIPRDDQVHPRFKRDALGVSCKREDPLTRSDLLLDSRQWSSLIVGKISEVGRYEWFDDIPTKTEKYYGLAGYVGLVS